MVSPARSQRSRINSNLPKILIFAGIGVINTLADLALFAAFVQAAHWPAPAANVCSASAAICLSFALNRNITFRQSAYRHGTLRQFIRFAAINLIALALSTLQVGLLALVLPPMAAKLLSIPLTFAWGFIASQRFVFHAPEVSSAAPATLAEPADS